MLNHKLKQKNKQHNKKSLKIKQNLMQQLRCYKNQQNKTLVINNKLKFIPKNLTKFNFR